ncbi:hypothetical protein BaRGS_00037864 [Batillaria attramentaria]|uniref:Uncharacterized protein n=1 Tax=Batillaria attramentaria TaxID=370345 RepID=A0ABD0J7Y1_9CAEN
MSLLDVSVQPAALPVDPRDVVRHGFVHEEAAKFLSGQRIGTNTNGDRQAEDLGLKQQKPPGRRLKIG